MVISRVGTKYSLCKLSFFRRLSLLPSYPSPKFQWTQSIFSKPSLQILFFLQFSSLIFPPINRFRRCLFAILSLSYPQATEEFFGWLIITMLIYLLSGLLPNSLILELRDVWLPFLGRVQWIHSENATHTKSFIHLICFPLILTFYFTTSCLGNSNICDSPAILYLPFSSCYGFIGCKTSCFWKSWVLIVQYLRLSLLKSRDEQVHDLHNVRLMQVLTDVLTHAHSLPGPRSIQQFPLGCLADF